MKKWSKLISISTVSILVLLGFYFFSIEKNPKEFDQPILFSHKIHAKENKIACLYCHGSFLQYPEVMVDNPGMPSIEICMSCHEQITGRNVEYDFNGTKINIKNEISKLRQYGEKKEEIPWIKHNRSADHLHYYHKAHVNRGPECKDCHGEVEEMDQVRKIHSFDDSFCISCHDKYVTNQRELEHIENCLTCRCLFNNYKACVMFARLYHFLKSNLSF